MNCLFLVLLLLCCGNNGNCPADGNCGGGRDDGCREHHHHRHDCERRDSDCGCGGRRDGNNGRCERPQEDTCGCRNDFRQEPRFEQRPFMFNQNSDCGCDKPQNNDCN